MNFDITKLTIYSSTGHTHGA